MDVGSARGKCDKLVTPSGIIGPTKRGEARSMAVLDAKPRTSALEEEPPASAMDDPIDALLAELKTTLAGLRRRTDADPSSNPIQLLALAIKERMDAGALPAAVTEQLIQRLSTEAFARRAERLRRYLGETGRAANLQRLRALIHDLTRAGKLRAGGLLRGVQAAHRPAAFWRGVHRPSDLRARARGAAGAGRTRAGRDRGRRTARSGPSRGPAPSARSERAPPRSAARPRRGASPIPARHRPSAQLRWIGCAASCSTSRERSIRSAGPS